MCIEAIASILLFGQAERQLQRTVPDEVGLQSDLNMIPVEIPSH